LGCISLCPYAQVEKRNLEYSLAESQREAYALAAQLERASEILEDAQEDAALAQAAAASARSRAALLEKAWATALGVRTKTLLHERVWIHWFWELRL
jgi:hypothetical protein